MDKVLEKAKELRLAIEETLEFKEYMLNKTALENNEDVIELKHNIANLKAQGKMEEAKNLVPNQDEFQSILARSTQTRR